MRRPVVKHFFWQKKAEIGSNIRCVTIKNNIFYCCDLELKDRIETECTLQEWTFMYLKTWNTTNFLSAKFQVTLGVAPQTWLQPKPSALPSVRRRADDKLASVPTSPTAALFSTWLQVRHKAAPLASLLFSVTYGSTIRLLCLQKSLPLMALSWNCSTRERQSINKDDRHASSLFWASV